MVTVSAMGNLLGRSKFRVQSSRLIGSNNFSVFALPEQQVAGRVGFAHHLINLVGEAHPTTEQDHELGSIIRLCFTERIQYDKVVISVLSVSSVVLIGLCPSSVAALFVDFSSHAPVHREKCLPSDFVITMAVVYGAWNAPYHAAWRLWSEKHEKLALAKRAKHAERHQPVPFLAGSAILARKIQTRCRFCRRASVPAAINGYGVDFGSNLKTIAPSGVGCAPRTKSMA
jgi:hypothetical protein